MTAGGRKPPAPGDESVDVEDLFGDLFDDAPPTDPTAPMLSPEGDFAAEPDAPAEGGGQEITVEVPVAKARAAAGAAAEIEPPAPFAPLLPEMDAEIWQAGMIQALVSVPETVEPAGEIPRQDWLKEARLLKDEAVLADSPARAAALATAAGRAAELAGQPAEAAASYDHALAQVPSAWS